MGIAVYGPFHCREDPKDTLSVSYTIHTLSSEIERSNVEPGLHTETGFKEEVQLGREANETYLATSAVKELARIGVDIVHSMNSNETEVGNSGDNSVSTSNTNSKQSLLHNNLAFQGSVPEAHVTNDAKSQKAS